MQFTLDKQELCIYCLSVKLDSFSCFAVVCDKEFFMFSLQNISVCTKPLNISPISFSDHEYRTTLSFEHVYLERNFGYNCPLRKMKFLQAPGYVPYFCPSIVMWHSDAYSMETS